MKRYSIEFHDGRVLLGESSEGPWVPWEDVEKEIGRLKEENAMLRQEIYEDEEDTMRYLKAELSGTKFALEAISDYISTVVETRSFGPYESACLGLVLNTALIGLGKKAP